VNIDGADPGPAFQGIGAISGGGGNSRLLIDYPPGERARILDYLFSPHFGTALQMLKLVRLDNLAAADFTIADQSREFDSAFAPQFAHATPPGRDRGQRKPSDISR
ncbi:MAG TPA: hypothetical protein VE888_00980, partial [Streptosporangiaceae bacterium]|nr:hypothetical protein [Streptosporangiaceae bacterium]